MREIDHSRKYHNIPSCSLLVTSKFCLSIVFSSSSLSLGAIFPTETEDNACGKFGFDKQRALYDVMVFSGVVNFPAVLYMQLCSSSLLNPV